MAKSDDGGYSDEDVDELAYPDGERGGHGSNGEGGLLTIRPTPFTDTGMAAASKVYHSFLKTFQYFANALSV